MTRPIAGSPLPNAASPLIRLLSSAQVWYEGDAPPSAGGTVIDAAAEPWLFTSILNRGKLGGIFNSISAARSAVVGNLESNAALHRVPAFEGIQRYQDANIAVANLKFLHDGTGCTIFIVHRQNTSTPNAVLAWTSGVVFPNGPGVVIQSDSATPKCFVTNAAASILSLSAGAVDVVGAAAVLTIQHGSGLAPTNGILRWNGIQLSSDNYTGVPSAANAANVLRLAANPGGTGVYAGDEAAVIMFGHLLTTQEMAFIENYLSQKYCRPDAITRQAMTLALRPELPNAARLDTAAAPTACDRVWDSAGKAHDAYQTTDAKEPLLTTLGGQKSLDCNGSTDAMAVSPGVGFGASTSWHVITAVNPDAAALSSDAAAQVLYGASGSPLLFALSMGSVGAGVERTGIIDAANRIQARAVPGLQLLEWAQGSGTMYRNGVLIGSAATGVDGMSGSVGVGARYNLIQQFSKVNLGDFIERDSLLTGTALWEAREKLFGQYVGLVWNAALVPDHVSILDPRVSDSVTTAGGAVSRVNSQHANIDVIADGSCEAAGVTAWTAVGGAVVTKQTPGQHSGTLFLQTTTSAVSGVAQTCMVIGQTKRLICWIKSVDGVAIPRITDGVNTLFIGTTSTNWQPVDVTFVAAGTTLNWFSAINGTIGIDDIQNRNVTAGAGTQAVAGNQPTHVAGAAGYFQTDGNDYIADQAVLTAASTMYCWVKPSNLVTSQEMFGGRSDATHTFYAQVHSSGVWQGFFGSTNIVNVPATTNWTPVAVMASGAPGPGYFAVGAEIRSVASIVTNVPAIAPYVLAFNNAGAPGANPPVAGTQMGPANIVSRVLSVRELMREFTQAGASYGWSLPAPMVPSDWDAQLCGCSDLSVTTPGGPVSAWADRLNRAGMGATSPGAAATFPQHSVVDNSVNFVSTASQYMQWVVPNAAAGSIEVWLWISAFPGGTQLVLGAIDGAGARCYISIVPAGTVFVSIGALGVSSVGTLNTGVWNHIVMTWNGINLVLVMNGVTATAANAGTASTIALDIGAENTVGVPAAYFNGRIAKVSLKNAAISVAQAVANFCANWDAIVNHQGV